MTSIFQNATPAPVNPDQTAERLAPRIVESEGVLREHATPVRARRRQRLALDHPPSETVYIVRSGLLGIEALPAGKHRQLLELFYPGDIIRRSQVPNLPGTSLTALTVSEVWRLPARSFEALLAANPEQCAQAQRRVAEQHARATLHASIVGTLNGDERFASLLVELGLRLGNAGPAGITIDVPLSRTDIADYLALNPDTLSRITSRFKARGLLTQFGGGNTLIPAWDALCASTPLAATLQTLHAPAATA
ncbi:MAG TPA: Crp/Fnr family transcriptional regulator [Hyphomicrobium sp.]|nr:Crp/Fnr family transcriptional regulator [Hyphomicrobium sp.]